MFDQISGDHGPAKLTHKISNQILIPRSVLTVGLWDPSGQTLSFSLLPSIGSVMNIQQGTQQMHINLKKQNKILKVLSKRISSFAPITILWARHICHVSIVGNRITKLMTICPESQSC